MSKEKQIEEMKKDLAPIMSSYGQHWRTVFLVHDLIELGYCKQREGTWQLHKDGSGTCSECHSTQRGVWDYDNWQDYCGCCGAHMTI